MPNTQTLTNGTTRVDYSTKETAQLIREALKVAFPGVKFSVRTSYGSMTSSTDIKWTDGPTQSEVECVTNRFSSKTFDGMTDSTNYHEQTFNGERVQFSGWVFCRREISPVLMQKALDRYNVQRADYGFGPAALEVKTDGTYAHVAGPDANKANPCGGRATWCPDAVYQNASELRANGCKFVVKTCR